MSFSCDFFFFLLVLTTIGTEAQQARLFCESQLWFEARAPPVATQQLVAVLRGSGRSYMAQRRLGKACTDWLSNRVGGWPRVLASCEEKGLREKGWGSVAGVGREEAFGAESQWTGRRAGKVKYRMRDESLCRYGNC